MSDLFLKGSARFSRDGILRREIRRWWIPEPQRWVAWLMLNPSKAGASANDPTAQRVTRFSRDWGYDGWIGVNLYPFISSTPEEMWTWADWENNGPDWYARDDLGFNLDDIERVGRMAALRVVAFGAQASIRGGLWLEECLEAFGQPPDDPGADSRLYCLGRTKNNQPLHPLARGKWRVMDGTQPSLWNEHL
jgi:hypothetical protein